MENIKFEHNGEVCSISLYHDINEKIIILDDRNRLNKTSLVNMLWDCNLESELEKLNIRVKEYSIYITNTDYPKYINNMFSQIEDINWSSFKSINSKLISEKLEKIINI